MVPRPAASYDLAMADHEQRGDAGEGDEELPQDPGKSGQNGRGMSRETFTQTVIDRVRQKFPLVKIGRAKNSFSVRVNGHVASLENLYRISRLRPDDLQHQVERWAVELLRAGEGTPDRHADLDEVRDRILPMLMPGSVDDAQPAGGIDVNAPKHGAAARLAVRPLVPGLSVGYVIDGDRTIAYVPTAALERWHIDLEELDALALENLVERSETLNAHAAQDEAGDVNLILFQSLDGFDASRLLLPNLHQRLREHLGSPFVAAVPNRDTLLCIRDDGETAPSLRRQIKHDHRTMPHSITDQLLLVTPDGIALHVGDEPL